MYPSAPGSWLIAIAGGRPEHVDPETAQRHLAPIVVEMLNGRSPASTTVKAAVFRSFVMTGRISFAPGAVPADELSRYPDRVTDDEKKHVEAYLRASFGAVLALDESVIEARRIWAQTFWRANWHLYPCWGEEEESVEDESRQDAAAAVGSADAEKDEDKFLAELEPLWSEFQQLALTADPDVYDPDRHEVLTGLTAHALRTCVTIALHRAMWIGEFSAPLLRVATEALIVMSWVTSVEVKDPLIYRRFKEYGRGRLKLLKLHAEEFLDSESASTANLRTLVDQLNAEVNEEYFEEFQDISLEGSFAGVDIRRMATESGLEWAYRLSYAPMSAVTHSEWSALARYTMARCHNPLHRLHQLPRSTFNPAFIPVGGAAATQLAHRLVEAYRLAIEKPARADP
jgi:hypothetical protein